MEYCIVSGNYPTENRQVHVFLENVVNCLVDRGEKCNVVAPQSVYAYFFKRKIRRVLVSERKTPNENTYSVYSPLYVVFPKIKIGKLSLHDLSRSMFYKALKRTYRKFGFHADLVYSHFVQAGIAGVRLADKLGIPSFIANGEADTIDSLKLNNPDIVQSTLEIVTGIISVSTKNKNEIEKLSHGDQSIMEKVCVIVNAVDNRIFYKKNKKQIREKMGWPIDKFIVAFTGSFIERKGILKLSMALDHFDDVYSIFMGIGSELPNCKNILHCGRVSNAEISNYLNAADVFVLPTLAEGCSNAIVEAVSCGLPVVSSDLDFNYDILDNTCSILIDPNDENAIIEAIHRLKSDVVFRKKLEDGAKIKAQQLSLSIRVDKIQAFINRIMTDIKN